MSPSRRRARAVAGQPAFVLGGVQVSPGDRARIFIQLGELYDHSPLGLTAQVLHGTRPGPRLFVSACIHGDEVMGLVSVRQVLNALRPEEISGTLVALPVVNHLGLLHATREFPDGRDLNRCFPGSRGGTLASRFARALLRDVVALCTHGIDLHTAGMHRDNLPQVRADLGDPETMRLAMAFGAPVVVHSKLRDGSLREAATSRGVLTLLVEAGQPMRHDDAIVRAGRDGVLRVMAALGMIERAPPRVPKPLVSWATSWVRAPRSGYFIPTADLGDRVREGGRLGGIEMPAEEGGLATLLDVASPRSGLVIGISRNPLVHVGDPLVHVADLAPRERARVEKLRPDEIVPEA